MSAPRARRTPTLLVLLLLVSIPTAVVFRRLYAVAPSAPVNLSPANQATGVTANPSLCASVSDPDGGTLNVTFQGREVTMGPSPDFTVIALPDTQYYAQTYPQIFNAQTQWIVDNAVARNIVFATQLGDCVNDGDTAAYEWANADSAFSLLEGYVTPATPNGMPYGITVGNHDQTPIGTPRSVGDEGATTLLYNQTFGVSRFQGRTYYGGHHGSNNDNHFELFSASGMDFINVALEYDATSSPERTAVLDWADGLLKTYGSRRAIVTSHHLLNPNASFGNQGQATYDALKDNPNLFLMLCGHLDQAARRTDLFSGSTIHTLLSDYQTQPSGGNGWLRILTFSPDNDAISVQTYSPWLNQNLTNDPNQFTLAYDMQDGAPFQTIGTVAGVASGGTACVSWPGRQAGTQYEWFATSSDGASSTAGPHWTFASDGSCAVPADCDDGNVCTADTCDAGSCTHAPIADCCNVNSDCNDGNACTADSCGSANPAALSFNGSSDYVTMGAAPGLDAAQFTVEFWVKRTGTGQTASTGSGGFAGIPLVTKGVAEVDDADARDMNYFVGINDSLGGVIGADFEEAPGVCSGGPTPGATCSYVCSNSATTHCSVDSQCPSGGTCTVHNCGAGGTCDGDAGLNHPVSGATPIPSNVWTHVAVTYDGSTWRVYVNGNADGSLFVGRSPRYDSTQHFGLGTAINSAGTTSGRFQGLLDEIRVFKRALTEAEIQAGMNSQIVADPDLVGHFSLNEGMGVVAGDSAPPPENGSIVGATWATAGLVGFSTGACVATPIPGCCLSNADCDDGNACTTDACNAGVCAYTYSPAPGCCATAADCDDGSSCTDDACDGTGTCANTPNASCCLSNTDCDDGNACTTDLCSQPDTAALSFDGSTGQVSMGAAPDLGTAVFTLETWFRWNGGGAATSTGTGGITAYPLVTKGRAEADNSNVDMNYFLGIDQATGRLAADFEEGSGGASPGLNHPVIGTTAITTGAWHHAAVTYDGTCWQLYLDGQTETAGSNCPGQPPRSDSIQHFALATAMNSTGVAAGRFNGRLDEVRLWGEARTQLQIQQAMNAAVTSAPGLIARWGLDEGTGSTAGNSTEDQNSGTLSGGATWVTTDLPPIAASQCAHVPLPGCCVSNAECDDGNLCTADVCIGNGCQSNPIPGCCLSNADCNDGNACTTDACSGNTCQFNPIPGCCLSNGDCDDGNACTTDLCSQTSAALSFDGSGQVAMGTALGLGASAFTLETWFRWNGGGTATSTGTSGLSAAYPLVTKGRAEADGSNLDMNYFLGIDSTTSRLAADFEEGAGGASPGLNHPVTGTTTITTGVWHHAAVTYNGACWQLYLDGLPETAGTNCPNQPPRSDSIQHFALATAMTSTGAAAGRFNGSLDEVRVWNQVRSQQQIQQGMNSAIPSASGLIGRWGLDEGTGTTAGDSTGNQNTGILSGGTTWITTNLPPIAGNQCFHVTVPGCCLSNADCNDGNACTSDVCSGNTCQHNPIAGCCLSNADCDDADACTTDTCQTNVCSHLNVCCDTAADCNDGNSCTTDACVSSNPAALSFDGTNDYVTMGQALGLGAATFTLETWVKRNTGGATASTGTGGIAAYPLVTKGRGEADGSNLDLNYFLGIQSDGRLAADFEEGAGGASPGLNHPIIGSTILATGVWRHAAVTYDGSCWKIYLDGVAETLSGTACPARPPRSDSIQHFGFGTAMNSTGVAAGFLSGFLDEVRVWKRALTQAEIQAYMNTQALPADPDLIGHWSLNEGMGTLAVDSALPAQNGALTNSPAWATTNLVALGPKQCTFTPVANGTACSDGNACTQSDTCQGGTCTAGAPMVCTASDQCHDAGTCDPATGVCSNPAKPNGTTCSDGNACTQTDTCQGGVCASGPPPDCDDLNVCTDDSCDPATGCVHVNNTASCDDGDVCNGTGTCQDGSCAGTPPPNCDDGNVCTTDSCDPVAGCQHVNNTASCEDGSACTVGDTCSNGACASGAPVVCAAQDQCHDAGVCDPATGVCSNPAKPDGTPCSDGSACSTGDACLSGACAGTPVPDGDGDGFCDAIDLCPTVPNPDQADADQDGRGDACDNCASLFNPDQLDSDAQDGGDVCDPCPADATDQCNQGGSGGGNVDETGGVVSTPSGDVTIAIPPGALSGDTSISINGGVSGFQVGNGSVALAATLGPAGQTFDVPVTVVLKWPDSDGDGFVDGLSPALAENDLLLWKDGVQIAGPCADFLPGACTTACCDPAANAWTVQVLSFSAVVSTGPGCGNGFMEPGEECDDGNLVDGDGCSSACTLTLCGDSVLDAGEQCDDGNVASGDCCSSSCQFETAGSACADGSACTTADACDGAGTCVGGPAPDCSDGNVCTDDSCASATGCLHTNNAASCDDGNACTAGDVCAGGTCQGTSGEGLPCSTGRPGICAAGTTVCSSGALVCVANTGPTTADVKVQIESPMKFRANSATSVVEDRVLVELLSSMKFKANSSDPGIGLGWIGKTYNDSSWTDGEYGVGYDTAAAPNALNLIKTTVPAGTFSVYTRAIFTIDDVTQVRSIYYGVDFDDGYIAYVNGVEVARSSMPAGDPAWNTNATLHESSNGASPNYGTLVDISAAAIPLLQNGANVLAVGVWNSGAPTSTDLVVVPRLSMGTDWTAKNYVDTGWSDGTYGAGYDTGAAPNALQLIKTSVPSGTLSVFTRAHFNIPSAAALAAIQGVFLGKDYDDGVVAWVNGVEVFGSLEMPMGLLSATTPAALHESSNGASPNYGTLVDITTRALPALVVGDNVLAVGVWNANSTSTDLVVVPRLSLGEAETCNGLDDDCDGLTDEGFLDSDRDGQADCADPDDDNDVAGGGEPDATDCAPLDPLKSDPPPAEVASFQWIRGPYRKFVLSWTGQGEGVVYDLAGGLVSQLKADGGVLNAECVAGGNDLLKAGFDDTRPDPARGQAYYYVVRAQKSTCGAGTYGYASSGAEHQPPNACP